ncbi:hypothetical protein Vafri_7407 [Volvox africanus]|uniref:Protein NEOXANTHIN-DEFICIENT 1 n=1 Tax=Volvox africanus TaxID=51714 RepID=A0A8J4B4F4_9CHLO|nr:hypothetical protein Vafri_7407 [Volvox africanus]
MVYGNPPWVFKGKALYQLQLVKSDEARKYIPDKFKLVEAFGYTLGGFYLARYEDSPAGAFDELVAMAGLVWNPPTSCAWAARVYVNNREARDHGVHHVGLPSRLAAVKLLGEGGDGDAPVGASSGSRSWWCGLRELGAAAQQNQAARRDQHRVSRPQPAVLELRNVDRSRGRGLSSPVCWITMPNANRPLGPRITLSLPSFSGGTPEVPGLLRYACDLQTNVGLVAPLAVEIPSAGREDEGSREYLGAVLGGRPLLTLEFAQMEMRVEAPEALLEGATAQEQLQLQAAQSQQWAGARTASLTAAWAAKLATA